MIQLPQDFVTRMQDMLGKRILLSCVVMMKKNIRRFGLMC